MSATSSLRSLAHWPIRAAHDQLTAAGIDRRLRVVGLAILMLLALAHQPAVRVAQIALRVRGRGLGRRLRMLALGSTPALLPRRYLGLPGRALRRRPRLGLRFQMATRRIELVAQGLAAGNLLRQGLGILLASRVRRLRPAQQRPDLAFQLGDQPARALIRHRTMLARVGLELGAVDAHQAHAQQLQLPGQKQNLQEALRHRSEVLPPEARDRIVVGVKVRRNEANPDIAVRRPLDPTAGKDPVGVAVDQQHQHHTGVILRRARAAMVHLEGVQIDALDRLDHEMRQIIRRDPVPQIGGEAETPGPDHSPRSCSSCDSKGNPAQSPTDC